MIGSKELVIEGITRYKEMQKWAHGLVSSKILSGKLVNKICEICGADKSHAHHEDYAKPLDVRWLCAIHHRQRHVQLNKENKIPWSDADKYGLTPSMLKIKERSKKKSIQTIVGNVEVEKMTTRIPKSLKKRLAVEANRYGYTLGAYIIIKLT